MDFSKFFNVHSQKEPKLDARSWGGSGAIPAFGKSPAFPSLPEVKISDNLPRIPEPSADALKAAKDILQQSR